MTTEAHTFKLTRGNLQSYAAGTLKLCLFGSDYAPDYESDEVVGDLTGTEITDGTPARLTLTGVAWDASGDAPALVANDATVTPITGTVAAAVVIDNATGELVADITFAPETLTAGSLPIIWSEGSIATVQDGDEDVTTLQSRTVAGVAAVDNDYPADDLAAALQLAVDGITPITGPTFVYDPSGITAPNVYTSWSALIGALENVDGPKQIQFPQSCTLPAGDYDLNGATLVGNGLNWSSGAATVTCPTGVTLSNFGTLALTTGITLYSTSPDPIVTVTGAGTYYFENDAYVCSKTAPFFTCTAEDKILFTFRHGAGFALPSDIGISGGDYEAVELNAGSGFSIFVEASAPPGQFDDTVRGAGTAIRIVANPAIMAPFAPADRGDTQTNASDWSVFFTTDASRIFYDHTVSGLSADNIKDALDELAGGMGGGGGSVATDAIFDAKGDLAVGTGSDTAAKLTIGANDTILIADSGQATGAKWAGGSTARTALGLTIGANVQAHDGDLDAFAALSPSNDDIVQRKSGAWTNRTMAQVAADLPVLGTYNVPVLVGYTGFNGTWAATSSGNVVKMTNSSNAVNNYIEWSFLPLGGTYTFYVLHLAQAAGGQLQFSLDGSNIGSTVESYNASSTLTTTTIATGVSVTAGHHTLRCTIPSHNGSSTGYTAALAAITALRTA